MTNPQPTDPGTAPNDLAAMLRDVQDEVLAGMSEPARALVEELLGETHTTGDDFDADSIAAAVARHAREEASQAPPVPDLVVEGDGRTR